MNGYNSQGSQDCREIGTDHINGMLGRGTKANHPDNGGKEPTKEHDGCRATGRVDHIGVKGDGVWEIVGKVINQVHVEIGINTSKFYPLAAEDLVIRKIDSKVKGNTEEYGKYYADKKRWGKSAFSRVNLLQ